MINYDKIIAIQQRALLQLLEGEFQTDTRLADIRLTVSSLGVIVPVLREVEKILRVPLDDIEGLKMVSAMLGCGGKGCPPDEMQACLQCCRKLIQELRKLPNHCDGCDGYDGTRDKACQGTRGEGP